MAQTAEVRLRKILRAGYFPKELPPTFDTSSFAKIAPHLAVTWLEKDVFKTFWTAPEAYSIPRYGQVRRKLSIVNPVNQFIVAKIISDEWSTIHKKLAQAKITEFKSDFAKPGNRPIQSISFDQANRRKIQILSQYGRYLRTDIARFYPSIYTHSIAWAIHGKAWCKANMKTSAFMSSCGNRLDKAVLSGQSGQTIGIPIGPDTSRVIAELIATEVEVLTLAGLPDLAARGVRYVDDWIIGFAEGELASNVLSKLSSALQQYELELNGEKTSVSGIGHLHSPDWIHFVRTFKISSAIKRQLDDIDSFFHQVLHLADCNDRESVILYAAKRGRLSA